MFRAIFFDLDNTLSDDTGASQRAVALTCRRLRTRYPDLAAQPLETTYFQESTALWTDDPVKLAAPVRAMRQQAWRATLTALGVDAALTDEAVDLYTTARRETYALFPEALPLLRALRGQCHLGIITNGPADLQREKIDLLHLADEVDDLCIAGEVGISKPHPDIFHLALRRADCRPSHALMIGDSWEKDVQAARTVGMRALWIAPDAPPDADTLPHIRHVGQWLATPPETLLPSPGR